jgi:ferredoxin-NADP reductase/DMSO/TMAO reductase YedYZ heme-binding membrane subunit
MPGWIYAQITNRSLTMKDTRFAKFLVLVNGGVPLVLLGWDALHHNLGANPVNFAILTTGMLTLVFLMLTLLVTPIRKITGWNWLIFSRRTFGLYAFFYGSLHFLIFFGLSLDHPFSVSTALSEMVKRKYLFVGITALLLMVPLTVTSTNAMIKRLGGPRWRALHKLVYLVAILGVIHYYMQTKADVRLPLTFAAVLTVLLGFRLVTAKRRPQPAPAAAATPPRLWSGPLRVVSIVEETPDVRTFRFADPAGQPLPFKHQPGQYLVLSLLIEGKKVKRTYTIASSPAQSNYCEITVKREENGYGSRHVHETFREGHMVNITAPAGRFTFSGTESASIVLIAAGVGITPLMSILRTLTAQQWQGDIHFVYSAKTVRDIIFRRELEDLQKRFPKLRLHVTLTRAHDHEWTGKKGRITAELLNELVPDIARHPVYICGPASMMEPTIQLLRGLGVPTEQIKSEAFVAAKRAETASVAASTDPIASVPSLDDSGEPILTFQRSGKSAPLSPDKTLLEIAEDAGLTPDYECRSGICGRCKTKLLGGRVTMEVEDALDESEKSQNVILLCQAKATASVSIDV